MRVLQINCVYRSGSTGKIVYDLHSAYSVAGIESFVCYGRGAHYDDKNVYKTASEAVSKGYNLLSRLTGIQYGGSIFATAGLISKIKEIKPDIVHLHCINGFFVNIYKLLDFLKRQNIKTVLTLHAEFMHTGNCGHALSCTQWMEEMGCRKCPQLREATGSYFLDRTHSSWKRMKAAFDGFDNLIVASVSPWLEKRAKISAILRDKKHTCVLNGIETLEIFRYTDAADLRKKWNLEGRKVVLYVTAAFNKFKGADYIMELAHRMPQMTFLVVGNREDIVEHPANIIPIGRIEDQCELARYYSLADVTVLTSKKETFSMVCAESLACGTPVVGFEAGAPETICLPEYSRFCTYGDTEQLECLVKEWLDKFNQEDKQALSRIAVDCYSKERMCEDYLAIYREMLKKG